MITCDNISIDLIIITSEKEFYELTEIELDNRTVVLSFEENDNYDKLTFPDWIKDLHIIKYLYDLDNLPNNLESLTFSFYQYPKNLDNLPIGLKYLHLPSDYNLEINFLPTTLEVLSLPTYYNHNLQNLPHNLKRITMGYNPIMLQDISHCSLKEIIFKNHHEKKDEIIQKVHSIFGDKIIINFMKIY